MPKKLSSEQPGLPEYGLRTLFGDTVVVRILDVLTLYRGSKYSMSEIARNSHVSWRSFNRVWPVLLDLGIVTEMGREGPARVYSLNEENKTVKYLVKLATEVALQKVELRVKREVEVPAR